MSGLDLGPDKEDGEKPDPPEGRDGWRPSPKSLERLDLVNSYLPGEEDWPAKTILGVGDPARVAALSVFDRLFPSVAHQQDIRETFILMWMKSRTSRSIKTEQGVVGQSRKDAKDIIMSTFGQGPDEQNRNKLYDALAADLYDDD